MSIKKRLLQLLAGLPLALPLCALANPSYSVTFLPESFKAMDIGNNGQVVGRNGPEDSFVASIWSNGVLTSYGTLGGARSQFSGISSNGLIAGVSDVSGEHGAHAFLYQNGHMQDLGGGGSDLVGFAANSSGQVAGYSWDPQTGRVLNGFVYSNGQMHSIGSHDQYSFAAAYDINDAGVAVGWVYDMSLNGTRAFTYANGVTTELGVLDPAANYSQANGINNLGDIVGMSQIGQLEHAFLYSHGAMQDLGEGWASDINGFGQVVGYGYQSGAFLYMDGNRMDLNTLTTGLGNWTLRYADAINDAGQIIGTACNGDTQCVDVLLSPVPEPAAPAMLLAGLATLMFRRGRTRRTTARTA